MNKGMFYLLPFLVLTPVAASSALSQVEVTGFLNVLETVRTARNAVMPEPTVTDPKPISGRNINGSRVIKILKPRAGRNASRLRDRLLIKRN